MLLVLNLPLVGLWVQMLRVPYGILAPVIVLFTTIGVYSVQNQVFDIYSMLFFAVLGYGMRKLDFDRPRCPWPSSWPHGRAVAPPVPAHLGRRSDDFHLPSHLGDSDCLLVIIIVGQTLFFVMRTFKKRKTDPGEGG